jgi:hypothetical protein
MNGEAAVLKVYQQRQSCKRRKAPVFESKGAKLRGL